MKTLEPLLKKVKSLMIKDASFRDNDNLLIAEIWKQELESLNIPFDSNINSFFDAYINKKITSAENIRRTRQLIEESYYFLRGSTYNKRHHRQQEVIEEILIVKKRMPKYAQWNPKNKLINHAL